ncbi:hypothetical protein BROSI_A3151 [Candidatus Brocadia sinica JPN1]|uniref:Uncharacterized protein n=2 Tax=Candidatus Brocadiaceae TaxID=1127830 RepID=A0ABQ0K0K5_9BACT|nr:hypothetical protein BROSI_A3151 [Candidatus Brocadia sinica JPN1]GIK11637.1 MAG: hypothetical protein BroJett002_03440 [Candidatus Brocadia sinica]GJQ19250.1 MAG: hypothetical protein HBSIN01_32090 [Candidatus Brocadia sinica]
MAMAYRYGNRYQMALLPKGIEDYVGADGPVWAYDAFVFSWIREKNTFLLSFVITTPSLEEVGKDGRFTAMQVPVPWRSVRALQRNLRDQTSGIKNKNEKDASLSLALTPSVSTYLRRLR